MEPIVIKPEKELKTLWFNKLEHPVCYWFGDRYIFDVHS
jgi:hypothetical protein